MDRLVQTLAEAAKALGVAPSTLRHQIRLGKLRATKLARDWFVTDEEVERYRADSQKGKAA
jgi:excisionase family DNA binding protein